LILLGVPGFWLSERGRS